MDEGTINIRLMKAGDFDASQGVTVDVAEVEVTRTKGVGCVLVGCDGVVGRGRFVVGRQAVERRPRRRARRT